MNVLTKIGIAAEQNFFSIILANENTAPYFIHSVLLILIASGVSHYVMLEWALPRSVRGHRNGRHPRHPIRVLCGQGLSKRKAGLHRKLQNLGAGAGTGQDGLSFKDKLYAKLAF